MPALDWREFLVMVHIIGTSLGVGGATVTYYLFFRFVEDTTVDTKEMEVLHLMSALVIVGLVVLVVSGVGFVVVDDRNISNPKLWAKLTVVAIIAINAAIMHRQVFPILTAHLGRPLDPAYVTKGKIRLIFTTGAVSGVSWYTTVVLGAWRGLNFEYSYLQVFAGYLFALLPAIILSNLLGRLAVRHLTQMLAGNR